MMGNQEVDYQEAIKINLVGYTPLTQESNTKGT